jgi:hypothetical protein
MNIGEVFSNPQALGLISIWTLVWLMLIWFIALFYILFLKPLWYKMFKAKEIDYTQSIIEASYEANEPEEIRIRRLKGMNINVVKIAYKQARKVKNDKPIQKTATEPRTATESRADSGNAVAGSGKPSK